MECALLLVPKVWLPKLMLAGVKLRMAPRPIPVKGTVVTAGLESVTTERVPARCPTAVGAKTIWMKQLEPADSVVPQVLPATKSPDAVIE